MLFCQSGPGVEAALEMVAGVSDAGLPPAHVGRHAGPVIFQQGDYYGQTVNMASRIADYARPGEVLVTQAVVDASGGSSVGFRRSAQSSSTPWPAPRSSTKRSCPAGSRSRSGLGLHDRKHVPAGID